MTTPRKEPDEWIPSKTLKSGALCVSGAFPGPLAARPAGPGAPVVNTPRWTHGMLCPLINSFPESNSPREPGQTVPHRLTVLALSPDAGNAEGKGGKEYPQCGPWTITTSCTSVSLQKGRNQGVQPGS